MTDDTNNRIAQLEQALVNASARFGHIQTLPSHGASDKSYIDMLRAIGREGQWELRKLLTGTELNRAEQTSKGEV